MSSRAQVPVPVVVECALDVAAVDGVRAALSSAVSSVLAEGGSEVVLDLSGCDFVDATGYRLLADESRHAGERGVALRLVGARAEVVRVLGVLDSLLRGDVRTRLVRTAA